MTRSVGSLQDGELWIRCIFCGDSDRHPTKAHLSVNIFSRLYYCHRCGAHGKLTQDEFLEWGVANLSAEQLTQALLNVQATYNPVETPEPEELGILPGAGSPRPSALPRYHLAVKEGLIDVFLMSSLRGKVRGYHLRPTWLAKFPRNYGNLGFGVPEGLTVPIRLVEGPYDVLSPQDVCTFGFPKAWHLRHLQSVRIILCPDGDVWEDPSKLKAYFDIFLKSERRLSILAIELIQDGLDPDQVPPDERIRYPVPSGKLFHTIRSIIHERSDSG